MKFDEMKVVSIFDDNLDDKYIGKEGYFSDDLEALEFIVEVGIAGYQNAFGKLIGYEYQRPQVIKDGEKESYTYFYPVEED